MKTLIYVYLILLWSSPFAFGAKIQVPYVIIPTASEVPDSKIEIKNMPRLRSQDSFPICVGMASAVIVQKYICKYESTPNCADLPPEKEVSPLSALAWSRENSSDPNLEPTVPSSHLNITFDGSSGFNSLLNSSEAFMFKPESCFPLDQLANKYGANYKVVEKLIERAQEIYKSNKIKTEACESCLVEEINNGFGTKINEVSLRTALQKDSFEEFMFKIVFAGCKSVQFPGHPRFDNFPKEKAPTSDINKIYAKVREVLQGGDPLQLSSFCGGRDIKDNSNCTGLHALVISGYKEVILNPGEVPRKMFKVQNSYGADWQKKYMDGWIDAQSILENIEERPFPRSTLSWYH